MMEPILINKRILVVDDNTVSQMLVKFTLQGSGAVIEFAEDGKEAVKRFRESLFDLVLMDIQMPEMDGYTTTAVIRNELKLHIPIIAMTAHAMMGEKEKCLQS